MVPKLDRAEGDLRQCSDLQINGRGQNEGAASMHFQSQFLRQLAIKNARRAPRIDQEFKILFTG
jgi:hypothetical protein